MLLNMQYLNWEMHQEALNKTIIIIDISIESVLTTITVLMTITISAAVVTTLPIS